MERHVTGAVPPDETNTQPMIDELRGRTAVDMATACRALGISPTTGRDLARAGLFPCPVVVLPQKRNKYRVPVAGLCTLLGIDG